MSVLIRGIEMPKSCEKCLFIDYEEGFCFASGVMRKSGCYEFTLCPGEIKGSRHDDCPLVEIPTPHGKLIDADALKAYWQPDHEREFCADYFIHTLEVAPTVIEAESYSERELQRDYEASVEYAQHCERYEPTYDPETGAM